MIPESEARLLKLATYASVITATLLIIAKCLAWLQTGSLGVFASLVDSIMDAMASIINLFAVRYSLAPADEEHRFGHGKAESLAALAQATFIAGSAIFLFLQAIDRLINPQAIEKLGIGLMVMSFSVVATMVLLSIQRYVIARTNSTAIKADSLHYVTDLLVNASIIIALALAVYGWPGIDPLFAMGIAGYILYSAWKIGAEAFNLLMDHELPNEQRAQIMSIARSHEKVLGVHDLRTRQSGRVIFIQLHIELNGELRLAESHDVAEAVESALGDAFPNADIIIHQDPILTAQGLAP